MSYFNNYDNLPGMLVNFKQGGSALRNDTTEPKTGSILLLGTATDGIINEPVAVDDDSVEALFGSAINSNGVPNGSTLVKGYWQARKRGVNDIRLMRVTGHAATCKIHGKTVASKDTKRISKDLFSVEGNDTTILTLSHQNIDENSVSVSANGVELLTGFIVDAVAGKVTIQEGVTNAEALVTVKYEYLADKEVTGEVAIVANRKITLAGKPKTGTLLIKNGKTEITDGFTVADKEVTFTGDTPEDGTELTIAYTIENGQHVTMTDMGADLEHPFKTANKVQQFKLDVLPKTNSIKIYEDNVFVEGQPFTFDEESKTITINTKDFEKGALISIDYTIEKEISNIAALNFESYFGGTQYNTGSIEVTEIKNEDNVVVGKKVIITKPAEKRASNEQPLEYSSVNYPTLDLLANAITNDPNNGVYKASTDDGMIETASLTVCKKYFTEGDDGLNVSKQELFEALSGKRDSKGYLVNEGAYQLIANYVVDQIVPLGVYADDELEGRDQSFAYELGLACAVLSYRAKITLGVLPMAPCKNTTLAGVKEHVANLLKFNNVFLMKDENGKIATDSDKNPIDLGMYLSIVPGPEVVEYDEHVGTFIANPALDYACVNATILPKTSPLNKAVLEAKQLRYNFSGTQLNSLVAKRMAPLALDEDDTSKVIVVDGPTCAIPNSKYARITTLKVLRYVIDLLRKTAKPYYGDSPTTEAQNALSSAISKQLLLCKENGILLDSAFQLIISRVSVSLSDGRLELSIVPPQELRKITTVVSLKDQI